MPAADQNKDVKEWEEVRAMPTVLVPWGIFPLPSLNPYMYLCVIRERPNGKKGGSREGANPTSLKRDVS